MVGCILSFQKAQRNNKNLAKIQREKDRAKQIGILNKSENKYSAFDILEILSQAGVDLGKIQVTRKVRRMLLYTTLGEIKQDGIDINQIIKDNDLDRDYSIGRRIIELRMAYRKDMSETDKKHAERLGIIPVKDMEYEQLRLNSMLNRARYLEKDVVGEKYEESKF